MDSSKLRQELYTAIDSNNLEQLVEVLQVILESGVKIADRRYLDEKGGLTPLRYAIIHDHDDAAEVIMRLQRRDLIMEIYDDDQLRDYKNAARQFDSEQFYTVLHLLAQKGKRKLTSIDTLHHW